MGVHKQSFAGTSVDPPEELLRALFSPAAGEGLASGISLNAYKAALDKIANIVCTDLKGHIVYANENFCDLNKCTLHDILGKNNRIFNSGHHSPEFFRQIWETIKSGKTWRGEIQNRAMDGSLYWVDTKIAPRFDEDGRPVGYVALRVDITARKDAEALAAQEVRKRQEMEALLHDIVDTLPNGVVAYDAEGRVSFFNKAHKQIYEHVAPGIQIGRRRQDLVTSANLKDLVPKHGGAELDAKSCNATFVHHLPNDRWIQVQNRRSPTGTLVAVQTDVTELKRAEQQIAFQAERDSLTSAFNRDAFVARLSDAVERAEPSTLILVDLDDFKAINDGLGHLAGNELLCHVANCLQFCVRHVDMVARVGGDEFAILLFGSHTKKSIGRVMERLHAKLATPAQIENRPVFPCASMGVATFPRDAQGPDDLMKCADLALYQCKREARGGYRIFSTSMQRQHQRRSRLIENLKRALAQDQFKVVLQPQCSMSDGNHEGFEALVRWKLGRTWIPPEELISIAEEAGLISQLSHQIMDKALAAIARLKQSGLKPGILGINVVAAQLHEPDFVATLMRLLAKHGIAPSEIEIEVTENVILDRSAESISSVLRSLDAEGIAIALDDFGMGYASLTHLKCFPLARLKVDRSFISGMLTDQDDHVIVRTIISLAHNLGLQVIAEGIETAEQYKELMKLGCDSAQGYLIGRPMNERRAADHCGGTNQRENLPVIACRSTTARSTAARSVRASLETRPDKRITGKSSNCRVTGSGKTNSLASGRHMHGR